jgi:Family of unknown function (DUF6186)
VTARTVTIAGFAVLGMAAAALALSGRSGRLGLARPGDLLDALRSGTPARLAIVLGWAWLGWHFLAR